MTLRNKMRPDGINGMNINNFGSIPRPNENARTIAQKLDAADGKIDGKINATIWNRFASSYGGNQIKNYITVDNAESSINRTNQSTTGKMHKINTGHSFLEKAEEEANKMLGANSLRNFNHYISEVPNNLDSFKDLPKYFN